MMIGAHAVEYLAGRPAGVLHVGAFEAEERHTYSSRGWGPVIWVEMLPHKARALRARFAGDPRNTVLEAACWSAEVDMPIHRASNGQSSSLLEPRDHLVMHPGVKFAPPTQVVRTQRLDRLLPPDAAFNFISVDTQGADLQVLLGLGDRIGQVRFAVVEVNERELYAGCARLADIDDYFGRHGFVRTFRARAGAKGWGDALYVRVSNLTKRRRESLERRSRLYHRWRRFIDRRGTPEWDNWQDVAPTA